MIVLVLGLVLFFAIHSVAIVSPSWRSNMIGKIGAGPWKGIYSLISIVGLALIVWGYSLARTEPVVVYVPPFWLRHLALLLLIPVFILLIAGNLPGRIKAAVKHPMLIAIKLWAFAHLLANGMLADVLLFGLFLVWAVLSRISIKWREQPSPPTAGPGSFRNDIIAIVGGIAFYVVFALWLHTWLIGISPITR